jgi:4-amino-4-deoxy-L-arabinose transferase-like glycosyltransferase
MVGDMLLHEQAGGIALVGALGFKLFGVSLTVTRLVSAALGTLTVYIAYRLGQTLGGIRLGLAFSFILAVSPWHVTISRYATAEHVLAPLQLLLSLLFLVRAVNGGRVGDILLAAFFTSMAWFIYATNLVVPVVAALFLLYRAIVRRRLSVIRWGPILMGLGFFALLSYMPVSQLFPLGILRPNIRTGYMDAAPILSQWSDRLQMAGQEADQLFRKAEDPWFASPGPGLGVFQTVLLIPGILLAANALRQRRDRDFGILVLIGLPIAALPAVFAPDPSFRRLILVATLAALAVAFTLVRLIETTQAMGVSRCAIVVIICVVAIGFSASGAFGYFDRVFVGEELGNAWFRSLGAAVTVHLGREPLVVVVPDHGDVDNMDRYLKLMAYDAIPNARSQASLLGSLYVITSCDETVDLDRRSVPETSHRILILPDFLLDLPQPCGPGYLPRLTVQYPGSTVLIVAPPSLSADLAAAQP